MTFHLKIDSLDFNKYADGLIPAIIQDSATNVVLMLGFMNEEALRKTMETGLVCFFSRTKNRLWTKGEESGNILTLVDIIEDCDQDSLLVKVRPVGPVCHTGTDTCWRETNGAPGFLHSLENIISSRKNDPSDDSYTSVLFLKGINKVAQKVGEEAVELVIEAMRENESDFKNEAADLLFHYLILLRAKGYALKDIEKVLELRHHVKK